MGLRRFAVWQRTDGRSGQPAHQNDVKFVPKYHLVTRSTNWTANWELEHPHQLS